MKKWIALLLAVVMALALSACTGKEEDTDASTSQTEASGTAGATDATDTANVEKTEPSGTTGTGEEKESSSGDMTEDIPSTNADMEVDPTVPASAGDLTED